MHGQRRFWRFLLWFRIAKTDTSFHLNWCSLLIDAGPDLEFQLDRESIKQIDRIFITHWHYDHVWGYGTSLVGRLLYLTAPPSAVPP
jgi:phosphoribosyl 1,2-cyclic phosphodiesterase